MSDKKQSCSQTCCKPEISYPCPWQYKIIGESDQAIRRMVNAAVQDREYSLTESNVSRNGRYISMNLDVTVDSEEHRLELYRVFAANHAIKVVL